MSEWHVAAVSGERVVDIGLFRASVFRYLLMVSTSLSASFVAVRPPLEDMSLTFRPLACVTRDPSPETAADARLKETAVLRRTIGAGPTGSRSSPVCAEPSDGLDGPQARLCGRLLDIVDEYLREDRPR